MKKITLDIDDEVWKQFKEIVPSSVTLNDAVEELIMDCIESQKKISGGEDNENIQRRK